MAVSDPLAAGEPIASNANTRDAATSASLEFVASVNRVKGYATHAYISTTPSAWSRTRRPSM